MATIKKITEVEKLSGVDPNATPSIYVEQNGNFRRAEPVVAREAIGLGGIVVDDGMLCVEIE